MIELDGDETPITNTRGQCTKRDIVQFVAFNDYKNGDLSILAEEVLREVPDQFVGYMLSKGIQANPLPLMSQNTLQ
jgi:hypothetical protein